MPLTGLGEQFRPVFASDDPWIHMLFIEWPIGLAPALFTWLLPSLLSYQRGGMAWIGAGFAIAHTVLLPVQQIFNPWAESHPQIHPWLFGVFYVYALAGLSLCGVGVYDRKRSAVWGLLAVMSLLGVAVVDTLIWYGWVFGSPAVPYGFLGFWLFLGIGYLRRRADPTPAPDLLESPRVVANNRTRRSRSIPRKLLREGNIHLLPVYYLINLSDLGREGIQNSGSYRFADHIYKSEPSGHTALGRQIDAWLLAMPATQAFRRRYKNAQAEIRRALEAFPREARPLRILCIPCGIPRDLTELAEGLKRDDPELLDRIEYHGMDLDPELLEVAREFTRNCPVPSIHYQMGNALLRQDYPPGNFHIVVSTGLGEFLDSREIRHFYRNIYDVLAPGGTFYTSATRKEKRSDVLLSAFELITQYRTTRDLEEIFRELPWSRLTLVQDDTGHQTFVVGVK